MIAELSGEFSWWSEGEVLVRVGGVGYLVHLSARARERLLASREGEQTTLPVALVVREETIELHGFGSKDERATFLLLLSVPGIGPKSAHNILAVADPRSLQRAVLEEDPSALTRVSGIGKKMAQKIILELKGKILTLSDEAVGPDAPRPKEEHNDLVAALRALGYTTKEAREAAESLRGVPPEIDLSEKLRQALRILGGR
ncbi:MAG: Holliday junction ATP-dependent DNA helicase RuvA [Candidatus Parcubacteria bacterium]|nr:MAG: Holliday junction ATP-dependent DNA helicase RuvA [Candidatus Parcubacteria bacterium]